MRATPTEPILLTPLLQELFRCDHLYNSGQGFISEYQ